LFGAAQNSLLRLAKALNIDVSNIMGKPDTKWRLSCAIARWYKKNPQVRKRKLNRSDRTWNKI
jgi:hypothetical protein